jgi:hypothetical protein
MLARPKAICRLSALLLLVLLYAVSAQPQTKDSSDRAAVVTWSADLNGENETPAVSTEAKATAEFTFDFQAQTANFRMTTGNLQDVSQILLLAKGPQNPKGAQVLTLYNAGESPALPKAGVYNKTFTGPAFKQVANTVLNGLGVLEVTTKAHPNGEIVGPVQMRKAYR